MRKTDGINSLPWIFGFLPAQHPFYFLFIWQQHVTLSLRSTLVLLLNFLKMVSTPMRIGYLTQSNQSDSFLKNICLQRTQGGKHLVFLPHYSNAPKRVLLSSYPWISQIEILERALIFHFTHHFNKLLFLQLTRHSPCCLPPQDPTYCDS